LRGIVEVGFFFNQNVFVSDFDGDHGVSGSSICQTSVCRLNEALGHSIPRTERLQVGGTR
jgi:hypothetical protein